MVQDSRGNPVANIRVRNSAEEAEQDLSVHIFTLIQVKIFGQDSKSVNEVFWQSHAAGFHNLVITDIDTFLHWLKDNRQSYYKDEHYEITRNDVRAYNEIVEHILNEYHVEEIELK